METRAKQVEIPPLIKYYMDELGFAQLFAQYVPNTSMEIAPAQVFSMIVDAFHGVHLATIEQSGDVIHTALKGVSTLRR